VAGGPFVDAWQSLDWAGGEAMALKAEIDDFRRGKPYSVEAESYPDNAGGEILFEILGRPDLVMWAKQVGAAIGYLRSALNYSAYQIALIDCREKADRVEFPIFDDPSRFQKDNRIKGFAQHRFDLIESAQPYHGQAEELWWLHELARLHRHRLIRPVIDRVDQTRHAYTVVGGNPDDISFYSGSFAARSDGKIVVGRWHNVRPTETHVNVQPNVAVEIVVNDPLVRHEPLPALLFKMCNATHKVITALGKTLT